jgi:uncharacterized membrane protein YccC
MPKATNQYQYILKLALSAGLAYAIGTAFFSRSITYFLYGAVYCMHPVAGDNISYVSDKLRATALAASFAMLLNITFQANQVVTLGIGLAGIMLIGYLFNLSFNLISWSLIVLCIAVDGSYRFQTLDYISLRFWNIFLGSLVGMALNLLILPDWDKSKLGSAFARVIASIHGLYNQIIDDYQQGSLTANLQTRQNLCADIEVQMSTIQSLLGNAKSELWLSLNDPAPYESWIKLDRHVTSLYLSVLGLAVSVMKDEDLSQNISSSQSRLYQFVRPELEVLIQESRHTFGLLSQPSAFQSSQSFGYLLTNLPALRDALRDRISQIAHADLPVDLEPKEIKRVATSIYGLEGIALELRDLAKEINS